jgi:mRNA deadenylase 3'-5' endonuclease subunit Ccr4
MSSLTDEFVHRTNIKNNNNSDNSKDYDKQDIDTTGFDNCLIIRENKDEPAHLTVSLVIGPDMKIGLKRLCDENIFSCLNRLKKNVLKVYQKKMKILLKQSKKKKGGETTSDNVSDECGNSTCFVPKDVKLKLLLKDGTKIQNDSTNINKQGRLTEGECKMTTKEAFNKAYCVTLTIVRDDDTKNNILFCRDVIINPNEVLSVTPHKYPMVGFPLYPTILLNETTTRLDNCKFKWEKMMKHTTVQNNGVECENITLSTNMKYIPNDDDLYHRLLFTCTTSTRYYTISGKPVDVVQSKQCIFDEVRNKPVHISPTRYQNVRWNKSCNYRIMTYNILCEKFEVQKDNICAAEYLDIGYRQQIIAKEIVDSEADIVCLQECSYLVFKYLSLYLSHTEIYCNGKFIKKRNGSDGCVCFYNIKKFKVQDYQCICMSNYYEGAEDEYLKQFMNESDFNKLQQLPQVVQYILLKPINKDSKQNNNTNHKMMTANKTESKLLLLSNTHLTYLPNLENLRNIQCDIILKHASKIIMAQQKQGKCVSYIFAGDLNSTVETGIIEYLCTGRMCKDHNDFIIAASLEIDELPESCSNMYHSIIIENQWDIKSKLMHLHSTYGNQWNIIRLNLIAGWQKSNLGDDAEEDHALLLNSITNENIKFYCLLFDKEEVPMRSSGIHIKMGNLKIQWEIPDVDSKNRCDSVMRHNFNFAPCFDFSRTCSSGIPITVWTHTFRGTLDYIFFHNIKQFHLLPTALENSYLNDNTFCMPNQFYPSDHLSVVCEFEF